MITQWNKECFEEEQKSQQIFYRNAEFLKENLTDEPRNKDNRQKRNNEV